MGETVAAVLEVDNFSFTIWNPCSAPAVGELGVMERKEHPWSGWAVLQLLLREPSPMGCSSAGDRHKKPIAAEGLAGQGTSPSIFHYLLPSWPPGLLPWLSLSDFAAEGGCWQRGCWEPAGWMGFAASALGMTQHPHLYSLLLVLVGTVTASSSLGAWQHCGFALWSIGELWGAVVSLPSPDLKPCP